MMKELTMLTPVNAALSTFVGTKPEVGMGVTELWWSDRHAGTIVKVSPSGKTVWYTPDIEERVKDGMYAYTTDRRAPAKVARLTRRGWKTYSGGLSIGSRDTYRDPHF